MPSKTATAAPFNRHTGLLVIEVRNSNPNGDPDQESDPRTLEADGRGLISPVSLKRKVRDLVLRDGDVMAEAHHRLKLEQDGDRNNYGVLEARDRDLKEICKLEKDEFKKRYWDARLFGNTMLEAMKQAKVAAKSSSEHDHFISTGVVQMGVGVSIAPVRIIRWTQTNVSSVEMAKEGEKEKSRGMAPLSFRVVDHAVYTMPFFVNPELARKTGATANDLELLKFMLPKAYPLTASGSRASVFPIHCWLAEHTSAWGSCPDPLILDALTPRRKDPKGEPSTTLADYEIPKKLEEDLRKRLKSFVDLCAAEP
ncbi:MAG: type I CRISPR-associated protein Cas7 [Phycisphaerales bacterium]